jgi:hypothetical protein
VEKREPGKMCGQSTTAGAAVVMVVMVMVVVVVIMVMVAVMTLGVLRISVV